MARAQLDGVGRAGEVDVVSGGFAFFQLLSQAVYLLQSGLFQLVDLDANGLFLLRRNASEVGHQGTDFSFLAQVF